MNEYFLGLAKSTMDTTDGKIIISRNVIFDENFDNVQENKNIHEIEEAKQVEDMLLHVDFFKIDPTNNHNTHQMFLQVKILLCHKYSLLLHFQPSSFCKINKHQSTPQMWKHNNHVHILKTILLNFFHK